NFRDISESNPPLCGTPGVYRGLAVGDLNDDGALDLLVTSIAGPVRLFLNTVLARGHWLQVRALEGTPCRDAHGAEVTVRADSRRWINWVNPGSSYLCGSDPRAHFGLGSLERFDSIEVHWPDGSRELFPGGKADQQITLRKGTGRSVEASK